jgi:hypothetical protein
MNGESMTNEPRQMVRDLDPTNEHERGRPCFVHHPDAGGRCERTATVQVYGILHYCDVHGEEARIGALMEAHHEADCFFDRFRDKRPQNPVLGREIRAVLDRVRDEGPSDSDYSRALARAYPNPPERVRKMLDLWVLDEKADHGLHPLDQLLDALGTVHKLMRISWADGEDWLTEQLDMHRQELAARAACASEDRGLRPVG